MLDGAYRLSGSQYINIYNRLKKKLSTDINSWAFFGNEFPGKGLGEDNVSVDERA